MWNFPRGLSKGLTQMPSKYNLDVNIVNYLIAHKNTIGADSAMHDISLPRQSWGEGRFALGNIPACVAPTSPTGGSCPKLPVGEKLPTKAPGDPMDSPTPTEGLRTVTSSASCPGGSQSHLHHFCVTFDNVWSATIRHFLE